MNCKNCFKAIILIECMVFMVSCHKDIINTLEPEIEDPSQSQPNEELVNCVFTNNGTINRYIDFLYIPNIESYGPDCYISTFILRDSEMRMFICDVNGHLVLQAKEDGASFNPDYYKYRSVTPIIESDTYKTVGYVRFRFNESAMYANSGMKVTLDYDNVSDIRYSPALAKMQDSEQVVLLGDSKFGNYWSNPLPDYLMGLTGSVVYNCGFGGCRMAWSTTNGLDDYDYFSFSSICECISNDNFEKQLTNCPLWSYKYQIANLTSIDFEKPTTILVNYSTNDITRGTPLGQPYRRGDFVLDVLDRTKFLEAMAYGVIKVRERYPHIKFIFLSPDYRVFDGSGIDTYTNQSGLNIMDYYKSQQENAESLGVKFIDSYNLSFRTSDNIEEYTVDGVHFNAAGFSKYAQFLFFVLQTN